MHPEGDTDNFIENYGWGDLPAYVSSLDVGRCGRAILKAEGCLLFKGIPAKHRTFENAKIRTRSNRP